MYNGEESEKLIGKWMEERGVRDQMVIATKYGGGYRYHNRENEPFQSNFVGASAKSMHLSVRDSLRKLRTDYIDVLYIHWWDFSASVEEVMTHLHSFVLARKVLYFGVSDTPALIIVKANECKAFLTRKNGMTPFSVYQGRWNAAFRDMESENIPMCEDQGMGIVSWASLGGGQLTTADQRRKIEQDPEAPKGYGYNEFDVPVSQVIEKLAESKKATFHQVALAYLLHQSTYVVPIVGVQTVEHVKAIPGALAVKLAENEIKQIHDAAPFNPLFPNNFLWAERYHTRLTFADQTNIQMATWVNAPPKQPVNQALSLNRTSSVANLCGKTDFQCS